MNKPRLIRRIEEFRSLGDDWDGLGASAVESKTVDCAIRFVNALPESVDDSKLFVYPGVEGSVVFEFDNAGDVRDRVGEVEILRDRRADVWTFAPKESKKIKSFVECVEDAEILDEFICAYRWVFGPAEQCV